MALFSLCAGPTRLHERVRRRRAGSANHLGGGDGSDGGWDGSEGGGAGAGGSSGPPSRHWGHQRPPHGGQDAGGGLGRVFDPQAASALLTTWSKAIGESSLVQKIRQAASQPALASASGRGRSLADAADGVLGSLRKGLIPTSNGTALRPLGASRSGSQGHLPAASSHPLAPVKGPKCD
jgi:hypothetical protein